MEAHQLINQSSGDVEIYTPPEILDPVRALFGIIDIDPASSEAANVNVGALRYFTAPEFEVVRYIGTLPVRRYKDWGGLSPLRQWHGRGWMNPPFEAPDSKCLPGCEKKRCTEKRGWHTDTDLPGTPDWVKKIEVEYGSGRLTEACCITFAATSERWFQSLRKRPQCCPSRRTNYLLPDGSVYKGVTKGSAITYFGRRVHEFAEAFKHLGVITVEYRP